MANRYNSSSDGDEPGFFARFGVFIWVGLAGSGFAAYLFFKGPQEEPVKKVEKSTVMVSLPPLPPPPPPPPPKKDKPKEEPKVKEEPKLLEQPKMNEPEEKPEDAPPAAAADAAPVGTTLTGPGSDSFGLVSGKGGTGGGGAGIGGGPRRQGSKFGWYSGSVATRVKSALENNKKTRVAKFGGKLRVWIDSTGRVTRATVTEFTGDQALVDVIKNEIVENLQAHEEGPPPDMPQPIVIRLAGK